MPNRKQRKANRQAKRAIRRAKFKQSGFYQALHKEKPKGFRGHQKISKSDSRGGLTGKLGLKEKFQDVFSKQGHTDCPNWELDKNTGQKICTSGGGKPKSSGGSSSNTTKTTDMSSTKTAGGQGSGNFVMEWPSLNFNNPNITLPGFEGIIKASGDIETGGWRVPLEHPDQANEPTRDGVSEKEKEKNQRNENHFEISLTKVKPDED